MIHVLLAFLLAPGPKVVELPDESSPNVLVQAFIPAPPEMSDREQAAWNVLADSLYDGTVEFSRDKLIQFGSQTETPLLIEAMPDYIRIQVVEPKGGLVVASQILDALCHRATLTDEAVMDSRRRHIAQRLDVWNEGLLDLDLPYDKAMPDIVRNLYAVCFRPERMTIVYGGAFGAGQGQKEVDDRFKASVEPAPRRTRFDRPAWSRRRHVSNVSTYEIRSQPLTLGKVGGAAEFLAVFAIGVGKGGAMHRVLRDELGISYRQEAVLWPSQKGWTPRFMFARTGDDLTLGGTARDALLKDIEGWDEPTLSRARAMAESSFLGTNPLCPIWTGLTGAMGAELEDKCAWAGLTTMMSGSPVEPGTVTGLLSGVTLEELKAAAKKMLDEATIGVIPGM